MNTYGDSSLVSSRQGAAFSAVVLLHAIVGYAFYVGLGAQILKVLAPQPLRVAQIDQISKRELKLPPPVLDEVRHYVFDPDMPKVDTPPDYPVVVQAQADHETEGPLLIVRDPPALPQVPSTGVLMDPKHPLRIGEEYYPDASKRSNEEGRCVLQVTVAVDGRISAAAIQTSSGYDRLDKACLNAVHGQRMVPATENGRAVEKSIALPISWKLNPR